jgi:hypothetical protein
MSEKKDDLVEYRVKKPVFVNDTYVDPKGHPLVGAERRGKDVIVRAAPGLEGEALEPAAGGKSRDAAK